MIDWIIEWIAMSKPFEVFYDDAMTRASMDAFHKAHADIMESFAGDVEKKAEELMKQNMEKLLTIIDERMIVTFNNAQKAVYIGGRRIEPAQLKSLKAEAEYFVQSDLWRILHETPGKLAQMAMFKDDGMLENQLIKGRAILYTLDTQSRILETFKSFNTSS